MNKFLGLLLAFSLPAGFWGLVGAFVARQVEIEPAASPAADACIRYGAYECCVRAEPESFQAPTFDAYGAPGDSAALDTGGGW